MKLTETRREKLQMSNSKWGTEKLHLPVNDYSVSPHICGVNTETWHHPYGSAPLPLWYSVWHRAGWKWKEQHEGNLHNPNRKRHRSPRSLSPGNSETPGKTADSTAVMEEAEKEAGWKLRWNKERTAEQQPDASEPPIFEHNLLTSGILHQTGALGLTRGAH